MSSRLRYAKGIYSAAPVSGRSLILFNRVRYWLCRLGQLPVPHIGQDLSNRRVPNRAGLKRPAPGSLALGWLCLPTKDLGHEHAALPVIVARWFLFRF